MNQLTQRLNDMTPLQRAVFALKETQARLDALEQKRTEPIAIVGMACRFPGGASDPASFWNQICNGVDSIREVPQDRWNADEFYDSDPSVPGKMSTRWGGFLERIDEFDSHFFGLTEAVASRIDPQHRILLELAWEALEDAGLPPVTLRGTKVGVFIGIALSEYGLLMSSDLTLVNPHVAAGTSLCMAANRLSFTLGLQGPSMAVETACSSSLVAVHLACQSLRNGECEAALVGGSSLVLSPTGNVNLTKAGFCAADGRVRAFDAAASGYVRSDGAGMVVLKPLSAALKNGDPIAAVIRGSAVNQNGSSNGLTAPSRAAQEQVLREAYSRAKVSPGQVGFVESQGTGTRMGDLIEATALGNVLRQDRPEGSRCTIGALKTNIGHTEAASGIASLIKATMALRQRQLPPNLHFQTPNPEIPFAALPLRMPRTLETWPDSSHPRFAGVSAFGFGGSNAHVVLEEAPERKSASTPAVHEPQLCLTLSARTAGALRDLAQRYMDFLRNNPPAWSDVCHTAAQRREHHDCRLAIVAGSHEQAIKLLEDFLAGQSSRGVFTGRKPYARKLKVAFLFSDRPEGWHACFPPLAENASAFHSVTGELDVVCQRVLGWSLRSIQANDSRWSDKNWSRTAQLVLQLALIAWWRHLGIEPDAVIGEGVGELAAAAAAGILTTDEVLGLVAAAGHKNGKSSQAPLKSRTAMLPFFSSQDGKLHAGTDLNDAYWRSCLAGLPGVDAANALASRPIDVCLDAGTSSWGSSLSRSLGKNRSEGAVPHVQHSVDAEASEFQSTVAALYALGADLAWERVRSTQGRCVRIPTYPWQRQRLWALGNRRVLLTPAQWTVASAASTAAETTTEVPIQELRDRPELTVPLIAPRTKLEEALARSWSEILHVREIGVYDNFFELGGDSLQAMVLLNRLQEHVGETVSAMALFESQNINDLAEFLSKNYAAAISRRHPEGEVAVSDAEGIDASPMHAAAQFSVPVADGGIPRLARTRQAADLLARIDELDDDEVESLLGRETINDEVGV